MKEHREFTPKRAPKLDIDLMKSVEKGREALGSILADRFGTGTIEAVEATAAKLIQRIDGMREGLASVLGDAMKMEINLNSPSQNVLVLLQTTGVINAEGTLVYEGFPSTEMLDRLFKLGEGFERRTHDQATIEKTGEGRDSSAIKLLIRILKYYQDSEIPEDREAAQSSLKWYLTRIMSFPMLSKAGPKPKDNKNWSPIPLRGGQVDQILLVLGGSTEKK